MATIAEGASTDDERRLRASSSPRRLHPPAGAHGREMARSCIRRSASAPIGRARMHAICIFALERASPMSRCGPSRPPRHRGDAQFVADHLRRLHGLRCISHHCGLSARRRSTRSEASTGHRVADEGRLLRQRAYRLVVLSDTAVPGARSSSATATARGRHRRLLPRTMTVFAPRCGRIAGIGGASRPSSVAAPACAAAGTRLRRALGRRGCGRAPGDVVVCSSGSLAHVYFTSQPDRLTAETIETRYPA